LELMDSPRWVTPEGGTIRLEFFLPRHGVSLVRITR